MTKRGTCGGCEWWERNDPLAFIGVCRRHAPIRPLEVFVGLPKFQGAGWPCTEPEDYCGEFEPRQEQDGKED